MDYAHLKTDTAKEFVTGSVTILEGMINEAILAKGKCILGLSGGSTPRPVYEALGRSTEIDWSKVWIFLIDERYVSSESEDSNSKLIRDSLLAGARIPPMQYKYPADLPLEEWQSEYEATLADLLQGTWPDIAVLGMGEDGHIASLFPPVIKQAQGPELTVHTTTDHFAVHDRVSVTLPVLTKATHKVFLLKGEGKKAVWNEMLQSGEDENRWPAKAILKSGGCTVVSQW
ncbi:6-phosphogluconolactonase [Candidatus Peregrinibacteria bacterium CG10_big_fil_rev_8_21_14_0_10_49_24]|nr:MAG: 6-phosphogluconolactonase [Candidatus Peregrinibacteria bacterium CG11_big_fil_rev_8_21_14_0_20_49_14]PIR50427.1 MAG: 6-phosphogluconolactonase [Candidatus Peregrinibacteria bacterium CG10_big_fil_rev_8_21_14_0_10_49_24]PJA68263.1 MAG: 6-phosphogluconolactonase [Candidatus Peregrinibacteria bacterium CG_4_9_14_3_um_filter_49_12]